MANGKENLIPTNMRTEEEAREISRKGGKASGEARRRKRDLKERLQAAMDMPADPRVAKAMASTGIDINDNLDVVAASIMKGVMKSNPQMIDRMLELLDMSPKERDRKERAELEKQKLEIEMARQALELERQQLWMNHIKGVDQQDLPDDGFLEALKGSAADDWSDDVV